MAWKILLPVIAVPLVEVAVFIKVAGMVGLVQTLLLAVVAGMAGLALLKHQGLATARKAQECMERGEVPVGPAFDGLCLAAAGLFLLIPGFVGDVLALALLLPPVRGWLRRLLGSRLRVEGGPVVIQTEFREIPEDDDDPRRLS
ncbi:MAG: FxsA family protein [Alphaproteobacteria bacterium]|nr:FxsA family protein [Alphaproteobacteria bacterium]